MSLFISDALAAAPAAAAATNSHPPSIINTVIFIAVFFALFYFLFIRPQAKRQKEVRNMLSQLAKGDEVVTTSGIFGKVKEMNDDFIQLEIADNTNIKIQRSAVSAILPKGTMK